MKKILIKNSEDIYYPLCRETFEDTDVFYHGSNENYSEEVEKNGFITEFRPYDPDKLKRFAGICNEIDGSGLVDLDHYAKTEHEKRVEVFHNWHLTVGTYLRSSIESITFTNQYWLAMGYSLKQGGETIRAAVCLAKAVCDLLPDWKGKINNQLKDDAENSTKEILDLYKKKFDESVPCIYVARLDSNESNFNGRDVEVERDIPKESILARVVYPNGISPRETTYYQGGKAITENEIDLAQKGRSRPVPWEREAWEKERKDPYNMMGTAG